jgi:hypothetical protein
MLASHRLISWRVLPIFFLAALSGCGGAGGVVKVNGTLTYKGQPMSNVALDFTPENGRPSTGVTDAQGHFKLIYDQKTEGAVVGKHKVSVRPGPPSPTEDAVPGMQNPKTPEMAELLSKYSYDKSKIEVTIDKNTKDLPLNWD